MSTSDTNCDKYSAWRHFGNIKGNTLQLLHHLTVQLTQRQNGTHFAITVIHIWMYFLEWKLLYFYSNLIAIIPTAASIALDNGLTPNDGVVHVCITRSRWVNEYNIHSIMPHVSINLIQYISPDLDILWPKYLWSSWNGFGSRSRSHCGGEDGGNELTTHPRPRWLNDEAPP